MSIKCLCYSFIFSLFCSVCIADPNNTCVVTAYGNFANMIQTGNTKSHVSLSKFQGIPHFYALGALTDLQGEVIILDGEIFISPADKNDGHIVPFSPSNHATILATAKVEKWISIPIQAGLTQAEFEKFTLTEAAKHNIPSDSAFPFLVKGNLTKLHWHVVTGLIPANQRIDTHAMKKKFFDLNTSGTLLGFYTGKELEGVVSHIGKRFHIHYADSAYTHAGHVDSYQIGENALLLLPSHS